MEECKLYQISEIQSGLIMNRKIATDEKKRFRYKTLTMKSVNEGVINKDYLEYFESKEKISDNFLTKEGDIIFRLFSPFKSVLITKEEKGLLVPNQFCIIRIKEKITPEYLNSLINNDMLNINNFIEGVGLVVQRMMKIGNIKDLIIPIVPFEKQILIGKLYNEQNKLNILYNELIIKENIKTKNIINQMLEKQNDK